MGVKSHDSCFGMPASLTGMEGEGMGYRRKLYNKFAGCDCGEGEGEGEGEGMGYKTMIVECLRVIFIYGTHEESTA